MMRFGRAKSTPRELQRAHEPQQDDERHDEHQADDRARRAGVEREEDGQVDEHRRRVGLVLDVPARQPLLERAEDEEDDDDAGDVEVPVSLADGAGRRAGGRVEEDFADEAADLPRLVGPDAARDGEREEGDVGAAVEEVNVLRHAREYRQQAVVGPRAVCRLDSPLLEVFDQRRLVALARQRDLAPPNPRTEAAEEADEDDAQQPDHDDPRRRELLLAQHPDQHRHDEEDDDRAARTRGEEVDRYRNARARPEERRVDGPSVEREPEQARHRRDLDEDDPVVVARERLVPPLLPGEQVRVESALAADVEPEDDDREEHGGDRLEREPARVSEVDPGHLQVRAEPEAEVVGERGDGVQRQRERDEQHDVLDAVVRERAVVADALNVGREAAELEEKVLARVEEERVEPAERGLVEDDGEEYDGEVQDLREAEQDEGRRLPVDADVEDDGQEDDGVDDRDRDPVEQVHREERRVGLGGPGRGSSSRRRGRWPQVTFQTGVTRDFHFSVPAQREIETLVPAHDLRRVEQLARRRDAPRAQTRAPFGVRRERR